MSTFIAEKYWQGDGYEFKEKEGYHKISDMKRLCIF